MKQQESSSCLLLQPAPRLFALRSVVPNEIEALRFALMVPTLPSGTRLGRYEIKSPIAAGGMGEVYLAQDTQLDRIVAIKILPADRLDDPEGRFDVAEEPGGRREDRLEERREVRRAAADRASRPRELGVVPQRPPANGGGDEQARTPRRA